MTFEEFWNKQSGDPYEIGLKKVARIAWDAGAEANGAKTMKADRKDYIRRLISGIREQIEKDQDTIRANKETGDVTIWRWIDVELLCYVIEKEVLGDESEMNAKVE